MVWLITLAEILAEELFDATVDELREIDANNEGSDDGDDDGEVDFNLVAKKVPITQSMSRSKQKVYLR